MLTHTRLVIAGAIVIFAAAMWGTNAWAADKAAASTQCPMPTACPAPPPLSPLLERFRTLQGDWEGAPTEHQDGMPDKYTVNYRTTSGGSAVVETWFPGTDHEMVSVYYADGDKIVMTHYCILGNQPMMTAKPSGDGATLEFVCHGGGNLADENVPHMDGATYRFIDNDHMEISGTMSGQKKVQSCGTVDYHRVGAQSASAGNP
jgi:hypothetical protein